MTYVDGFILAVPKKNMAQYRKMARRAGKVWREHGAINYVESVADDAPMGKITSFPRSVKMKPNETVIFSWVTYKSRADRNRILKKVMADPRLQMDNKNMPFDGNRMIYGGFKVFLEL